MSTKLVSEWKIDQTYAQCMGLSLGKEEAIEDHIEQCLERFQRNSELNSSNVATMLQQCYSTIQRKFESERWIECTNGRYFDRSARGFWILGADNAAYGAYKAEIELSYVEDELNALVSDPINEWSVPNQEELRYLTGLSSSQVSFGVYNGRPSGADRYLYEHGDIVYGLRLDNGIINVDRGYLIPFLPYDSNDLDPRKMFLEFLNKGLTPKELENDSRYTALLSLIHRAHRNLFDDYRSDAERLVHQDLSQKLYQVMLSEDQIRADIAPYHSKVLHDTELGHWSLWQNEIDTKNHISVELDSKLVARDPKSSINDGVVAIDFGTKSTVVVFQKDTVNIHPMRIGTGDLSKEISAYQYENPTILEFKNIERFFDAYKAKAFKPFTRWCDLTISHTAQNSMQGSEASQFNTFLEEIKQWAGDKNRKLKIVCQQGKVIDLPPFLELTDDDFDPIEIYAYYLGLYINNLNNGIYLDYILSFPVTYELPVRDKIISSFQKGLKKSLPEELGIETINQLTVTKGASEPAAYALTALQSYGFEPSGDERVFYSVFDFGGGTTDFDFGIFREATGRKERRFDYVIEHFGAGGDKFLGGENLLELLAFEVFKKNKSELLAKGIQFEKHPEKEPFAGSEHLLSHSQEARTNTKQLCIALRAYWEEYEDFEFDSSGELSITLTDLDGIQHSGFALDINEEELEQWITERIERGVENFFDALRLAFSQSRQNLGDIDSVKIFLAGNSSRSRFVRQLFEKHIAIQHREMGLNETESRFELFAPLGTDKHDVEKPTGKTGVAFGLIDSREGGSIKVVDHNVQQDDIRFKFYLGESRKNKFKPLIDRESPFGQWIEFIDAGYQRFEIFYTDQPSASTGQIAISDASIKKRTVKLDITDDDALVYLRVINPTTVECVVANECDIDQNVYLNEIQSIEL
ncbi:dehydrogenase complex catalyzes the overall conversion of [Vibrio sp. B1REV9]|uniref:molecular chaperone DnaK n=1 Tax=Vibrio sp. B1REV9 TaxID=2751179 RepID=UPI001B295661|nr:molecular chaperone DnaK [Vibrio sp. B1REV9]CAE6944411.1 dehydrogenase complex catalyzes the overall conversion of [Vibrio sp. B1REV9]